MNMVRVLVSGGGVVNANTTESPEHGRLTVRRITSLDESLAHQLNALFDEGMTWDATQGDRFFADPANLLIVAYWDDQPCGFATAYRLQRFDTRRAEVLLYEIGVAESHQRRGIGSAMVEDVMTWAREVGAHEIWVLTERTNEAAMALYRATGGEDDGPGTAMFVYPLESTE
jgi:GNAT superfamily N-acetyltransferase